MAPGPPDDSGGGQLRQLPPAPMEAPPETQQEGGDAQDRQPPVPGNVGGPHQEDENNGQDAGKPAGTTPSDASPALPAEQASGDGSRGGREQDTPTQGKAPSRTAINYGDAVRRGVFPTTGGQELPQVTKIAGGWKPRQKSLLMASLARDWTTTSAPTDTPTMEDLRKVAMTPVEIREDAELRPRSTQETESLLAYMQGLLELQHPPSFLKATMPLLQRAMIEQFHESHVEKTLTADVSPRAKLRRNMTQHALFGLLYQGNGDSERGRMLMQRLMEDVKILQFDGVHTLKFTFHSRRIARRYCGLACRLPGTYLALEDSDAEGGDGVFGAAQMRRQYSVRVYHLEDVGLVALVAALGNIPGVVILDAERPRTDATEVVDNRYSEIHFKGSTCPSALRGVTKINMGGTVLTVHHHLVHARLPCARCYVPFHTTGFCRTIPTKVDKLRGQYLRTYAGVIPTFMVGQAVQYDHSEDESLTTFLTTLQGEIETELHGKGEDTVGSLQGPIIETTPSLPLEDAGAATAGNQPTAQSVSKGANEDEDKADEVTPDLGGYQIFRRKAAKPKRGKGEPLNLTKDGQGTKKSSSKALASPKGNTGGKGKRKASKTPSFSSFNKARAWGRFSELADAKSDNDDGEDGSDADIDDEAPYAYSPTADEDQATVSGMETAPSSGKLEPNCVATAAGADMDVDEDQFTDRSGYVGSSPPSQDRSAASTPGSEFPFSLASDEGALLTDDHEGGMPSSRLTQRHDEGATTHTMSIDEDADGQLSNGAEIATRDGSGRAQESTSALSQDGFEEGGTVYPTGMPQQLPVFLNNFGGTLIEVPANGQCAYMALYASTSYIAQATVAFTSEVVRNANLLKRSVYTLMMSNLAMDVECGLVDPIRELLRLYPQQPQPAGQAAAVSLLYSHYAQERVRSVSTQIPSEFWAGAEVLRAMAQYLREPVFVIDVDSRNDAHVQRYGYKDYRTEAGELHESGCGGPLEDQKAKLLFQQLARLHVLPVLLVLKKHEGHFYGVHHGEIAIRWLAEGDQTFTETNCSGHTWFEDVMAHMKYSRTRIGAIDRAEVSEEVDLVLIGGVEHRGRLDIVHDRMGIPRLDAVGYDVGALAEGITQEGERLQRAAGPQMHLVPSTEEPNTAEPAHDLNKRFPIHAHDNVAKEPMQRILDAIAMEPELLADRSKMRTLIQVNNKALGRWKSQIQGRTALAAELKGQGGLPAVVQVLLRHRGELHRLFHQLPYPELAAKMLPAKLLQQWGALEVYDVRIATLKEVAVSGAKPAAVALSTEWLAACTTSEGDHQDRLLAGDANRWERLLKLCPEVQGGARPEFLPNDQWNVLHLLPHVIWMWPATPWGRAPRSQLGHHFSVQPGVQRLCERVVERAEWATAVEIPSGLTWADRQSAMEAGLAAQLQY